MQKLLIIVYSKDSLKKMKDILAILFLKDTLSISTDTGTHVQLCLKLYVYIL